MSFGDKHRNAEWKFRNLPDGSKEERIWLVYSCQKNAVFCLHCLLFGSPNATAGIKNFAVNGYSNWVNASRDIQNHENSSYHRESDISLIRWNSGKYRIDKSMMVEHNRLVDHHRTVVSVIINCVRYLTGEMMAFRKSSNVKGKLHRLFKLLAKYNPDAHVYLEKVERNYQEKKRMRINFLAYHSILHLLTVIKRMILEKITERVKSGGGRYAIIVDGTQDVSKMESVVVLIRYIEGLSSPCPMPVERLIGAFTSTESTGKVLSKQIIGILNENDLNTKKIVGQSYDGGSNMMGSIKGVRTLIRQECPMAIFIWCYMHRFSLVIENSVDKCVPVKNFFGILEELHTFMNGHRRHGLFVEILKESEKKLKKKHLGTRRLKRVFVTRWSSKPAACGTLDACYPEIIYCLDSISKDKTVPKEAAAGALGLKMKISEFDFVATLQICLRIFQRLAPVTIVLQGIIIDFGSASNIIKNTIEALQLLRTKESWIEVERHILKVCSELGIERKKKRIIHRKRFFDENNIDESHQRNELEQLKIEIYYAVIDRLLIQMNERFGENILAILQNMSIFSHENLLKDDYPTRAEDLCKNYNLNPVDVETELKEFKSLYKSMHKEIDISDLVQKEEKQGKRLDEVYRKVVEVEKNMGMQVKKSTREEDVMGGDEDEGDYAYRAAHEEGREESEEELEREDSDESNLDSDDDSISKNEDKAALMADRWVASGFIKPLRLLNQLSCYGNLTVLYKTLVSLAATSCSAERALSKNKIIKNPLRSTMLDPWMSSMMILASELDIFDSISNEEIIEEYARVSPVYAKLLKK